MKRSSSFAGAPPVHAAGPVAGDEGSVHRGSQGKAEAPKVRPPNRLETGLVLTSGMVECVTGHRQILELCLLLSSKN